MDRSTKITVNGKEYELLLTTRAFEKLSEKYGGVENLGEEIMKNKTFGEIVWLVVLLANQATLRYNFIHKDNPKELLTEEEVELFTTPLEFSNYQEAIVEALKKGMKRNVESEAQPSKNVQTAE